MRDNPKKTLIQAIAAAVVWLCLFAVFVATYAWTSRQPRMAPPGAAYQVRWNLRESVEYVQWRLGLREHPPFVYLADEIQKIRPESTILDHDAGAAEAGNTD